MANLSPASHDFGVVPFGGSKTFQFAVQGATFTPGEVTIDGQDRVSFTGSKVGSAVQVIFSPGNRGAKIARLKVLIESGGPPYYIEASLSGTGA